MENLIGWILFILFILWIIKNVIESIAAALENLLLLVAQVIEGVAVVAMGAIQYLTSLATQYWLYIIPILIVVLWALYTRQMERRAAGRRALAQLERQKAEWHAAEPERRRKAEEATRERQRREEEAKRERYSREEEARRERQRREEEAKRRAHEKEQAAVLNSMKAVNRDAIVLFENLPKRLMNAEELLDTAETEFSEGVLIPFWDSIERAVRLLAQVDSEIQAMSATSRRYKELVTQYEAEPPPFPIGPTSVEALSAASQSEERLGRIVRRAHRNPNFASIFLQLRTNQILTENNQILKEGFTNFAEALEGMGRRITASLVDLGGQIETLGTSMRTSIADLASSMEGSIATLDANLSESMADLQGTTRDVVKSVADEGRAIRDASAVEARNVAERHHRALEMLDNLQRGRKPLL